LVVRRKLSELLDEVNRVEPQNFWRARLLEMQAMLKERRYSALERRIHDLLESDRVTGRVKAAKPKARSMDD
jgi:predicted acetyltransferase